jgi:hypothetical protein
MSCGLSLFSFLTITLLVSAAVHTKILTLSKKLHPKEKKVKEKKKKLVDF